MKMASFKGERNSSGGQFKRGDYVQLIDVKKDWVLGFVAETDSRLITDGEHAGEEVIDRACSHPLKPPSTLIFDSSEAIKNGEPVRVTEIFDPLGENIKRNPILVKVGDGDTVIKLLGV